jgi:hypothetical protein
VTSSPHKVEALPQAVVRPDKQDLERREWGGEREGKIKRREVTWHFRVTHALEKSCTIILAIIIEKKIK